MPEVANLQVVVSADTSQAEAGISRFGSSMGTAVAAGAAAATAAIVGVVAVGVKAAGDLEQAVANISTIKPDIDTSAVFASLNEMSTRIPQTAAELGDSLYNIFSSMDVGADEAMTLLETFSKGAVGAGTDAQTFGTAAMGVMNAYKLEVTDAAAVSDMFFDIVNKGVVTGEELAASLGPVVQSAKAMGVSWKDLGPMIAAVTKEGGPAAQNINNLNNLFMKFSTTAAQTEMHKLGIKTTELDGSFRKLPDVMVDLKAHLATLTEAEGAAAMQAIFPDAQARQGAQTIMSQIDFVNEALKTSQQASGSTEAAFAKMSATFNSQSKLLMNTLMAIATTIGGELLPYITPIITAFAQSLPAAFKTAGDAWRTVVQVFQGDWSPSDKIDPLVNSIGLIAISVRAMWTAVQPALQQLITFWTQVFAGDLPAAVQTGVTYLQTVAGILVPILAEWGLAFVSWVAPFIPPLLAALADVVLQLLTWVVAQVPVWTAALLAWGQEFVAWVAPQIPPLLAALGLLLAGLTTWIVTTALPAIVTALVTWGMEFANWIATTAIPQLAAKLPPLLATLLDWVTASAPGIVAKLVEWAVVFAAWPLVAAVYLLTHLPEISAALYKWITEEGPGIAAKLIEWTQVFGTWVTSVAADLAPRLAALGTAIAQGIFDGLKAAWDRLVGGWTPTLPAIPGFGGGGGATQMSYTGGGGSVGGGSGALPEVLRWSKEINAAAAAYGISPSDLAGLVDLESSGNPRARSGAGAMGLGQVMPFHFKPGEDPYDPQTNLMAAARVYRSQLDKYGDPSRAAAGYFGAGDNLNASDGSATGHDYIRIFNERRARYQSAPASRDMQRIPLGGEGPLPSGWAPQDLQDIVDIGPPWEQTMSEIKTSATEALGSVLTSVTDLGDGFTLTIRQVGTEAVATITDAGGNITGQWGQTTAAVTEQTATMAAEVPAQVATMTSTALTSVTDLGGAIMTNTTDTAGNVISTITNMSGQVTAQYATLSSGAQLSMADMGAGILVSTTDLGTGVMTIMQDMSGNTIATITDMSGNVVSQYVTMGAAITTVAEEASGSVTEAFADVEIEAPDVGDVIAALEEVQEEAEKTRESLEDLDSERDKDGGGKKESSGRDESDEADFRGFATGGIVYRPETVRVAEREPEAIIPLSRMADFGPSIDYDEMAAAFKRAGVGATFVLNTQATAPLGYQLESLQALAGAR